MVRKGGHRMRSKIFAQCLFIGMVMMPLVGHADSLFTVSSAPTLPVESGVAELAGSCTLTLTGGTTEAGSIAVLLSPSVTITNTPAAGIQFTATGDLSAAQLQMVSASPGYLMISVPEGASTGTIAVSGLRVDLSSRPVPSLQAY